MTFTLCQNIIIPLFLHFEAFAPSSTTAAEFLLAWTIAQVLRVNYYILLSIFSCHKILSTELEMMTKKKSHCLERLIKNMVYIPEQMWEEYNWKWNVARPFWKPFLSHRGNGCTWEGFCNLSSGNCPHLQSGLNIERIIHY